MIKRQEGQATIEFILTATFSLTFLLLFVNLAFSLTTGYVVHLATFSAARAYLVADNGSNEVPSAYQYARGEAEKVMASFPLSNLGVQNGRLGINSIQNAANDTGTSIYQYVGVWYQFQQSLMAFFGSTPATFVSEAFLGKEPTRSECHCQMQHAVGLPGGAGCSDNFDTQVDYDVTLFDNGC